MAARIHNQSWLLPAALILFLLEVLLLPFAAEAAYAGSSEAPAHTLTYTTGSLTWDSATGVDENGAAYLNLFDSGDPNVLADNGDTVVAPGTSASRVIRLRNDASHTIRFAAVLYSIKEEELLPVVPALADSPTFEDADWYPLPEGVSDGQVVRAVTGTVEPGELQDFSISWAWDYFVSDERDKIDTALGDRAAFKVADDVTAGIYIVIEENLIPLDPGDPSDPGEPLEPASSSGRPGSSSRPGMPAASSGASESSGAPSAPETSSGQSEPSSPREPSVPGSASSSSSDSTWVRPDTPKTGDSGALPTYAVLMAVSGAALVLLLYERGKEKKAEEGRRK